MQQYTLDLPQLSKYFDSRLPGYIDLLRQMVEINSFTTNPNGVNQLGKLTAGVYKSVGFEPEFVQSTNPDFGQHLFLHHPSGSTAKKSIALVSHLDTVFSPDEEQMNEFTFRRSGDKIYGPGSVDIKGGTVLVLMVLEAIQHFYPQVFDELNWLVCLDASEETMSDDFGNLCKERIPADALACLIFEGGTPNPAGYPVVISRKGRAEYLVSVEGRGAHAGNYHQQGANAIVQLADVVSRIASFTDYAQHITFNVGVIHGGSVVNRVPHHAKARVEMRAFSPDIFETGYQKMMSLNGASTIHSQDGYPCQVNITTLSSTAPWPRNEQTERLFHIWRRAADMLGMHVLPEERGGLSDGNLLWQGLPVLDGLGPSGANAHCSENAADGSKEQEYASFSSFAPKALLNMTAIFELLRATEEETS